MHLPGTRKLLCGSDFQNKKTILETGEVHGCVKFNNVIKTRTELKPDDCISSTPPLLLRTSLHVHNNY